MLKHEHLDSLNIFVFANNCAETPPRQFHLNNKLADSWNIMKRKISETLFSQNIENIHIYTLDGILISESIYLIDNNGYVAVPAGEAFLEANYKKCLLKIIRLRNKHYCKESNVSSEVVVNNIVSPAFSDTSVTSSDYEDSDVYDKDHGDSECGQFLLEEFYSSITDSSVCGFRIELSDLELMESETDSSMDIIHLCQCQARREQVEEMARRVEAFNSVQKQEAAQRICQLQNKLTDIADELNNAFETLLEGPVEATYAVSDNGVTDAGVECNMFPVSHTSRAVHLEHYIQYQIKKHMDDISKMHADQLSVANQTDNKEKGDIDNMRKLNNDLFNSLQSEYGCRNGVEVLGPNVQTLGFVTTDGFQVMEKTERGCSALDIRKSVCSAMQKMTQTRSFAQPVESAAPNDKTHYLIRITPELEKYIKWQLEHYVQSINSIETPPPDQPMTPPQEANKQIKSQDKQEQEPHTFIHNTSYSSHKQNVDLPEKYEQDLKIDISGCQYDNTAMPCRNQCKGNNRYHLCACVDAHNLFPKQENSVPPCADCDDGGDEKCKGGEQLPCGPDDEKDCELQKTSFSSNNNEDKMDSAYFDPSLTDDEVPRRATARKDPRQKKKSLICGTCCPCRTSMSTTSEISETGYKPSSGKPSPAAPTEISGLKGWNMGTQTSLSNMLLIPKLQEDGHYELHIPPLDMIKYQTVTADTRRPDPSKNSPK